MLLPHMNPGLVRIVEQFITEYQKENMKVLEWGIGGSTVHFARFLKWIGVDNFNWYAIESDIIWAFDTWQETIDLPVHIKLFEYNSRDLIWKTDNNISLNIDDYVEAGKNYAPYDVIFVDGYCRPECIILAKTALLDDGGVIILHDAQREEYHQACEGLQAAKFVAENSNEQLWVMKI